MTVNKDNYYSLDTSFKYQSASWFKKFLTCEAEAMAELQGKWTPRGDPTALLVGNYLHSYFESKQAHESFIKGHPEMFSTRGSSKGQLKAPYKQADAMIATLEADENFQRLYQGEKEEILTGDLYGVEWMGKLDCFDSTKSFFLDLKTT
ncbi:PD-(D/E)XK nuclease-like domain-containing protein, partial [Lacticaseibacillus paracasei]|uniref:5'-3' exonuclease n=1 Tax=Lacticaseibacillus paracasei TaxID=1597 RepID=UPI002FFC2306